MIKRSKPIATGLVLAAVMAFASGEEAQQSENLTGLDNSPTLDSLDIKPQYATIADLDKILIDLNKNQKMVMTFYAMVGEESGYQHKGGQGTTAGKDEPTTSTANAYGLTQVRMIAFRDVELTYNIKLNKEEFFENADYNFYVGMVYFALQLKEFNNDYEKAIAAYNAGPTYVKRMIKEHGDKWLAKAYKETQNYVFDSTRTFNKFTNALNDTPLSYTVKVSNISQLRKVLPTLDYDHKMLMAFHSLTDSNHPSCSPTKDFDIAQTTLPPFFNEVEQDLQLKLDKTQFLQNDDYRTTTCLVYFAMQVEEFKGDYKKVFAARHADPAITKATIKEHGNKWWFGHMPKETRDFADKKMRKLQRNMDQYAKISQTMLLQ